MRLQLFVHSYVGLVANAVAIAFDAVFGFSENDDRPEAIRELWGVTSLVLAAALPYWAIQAAIATYF